MEHLINPQLKEITDILWENWEENRIDAQYAMLPELVGCQMFEYPLVAVAAADDPRYKVTEPITSNWSERHAAFIAGLGTFGISRGLITLKGMAGRFGSVITSMPIESTKRAYTEVYEYCIFCGACAKKCPAGAIRMDLPPDQAKDQYICGKYLDILKDLTKAGKDTRPEEEQSPYEPPLHREYFGCGKCQVGVPYEHQRPKRR